MPTSCSIPGCVMHMLVILGFFITRIVVPAYVMLGYWFLLQILGGLPTHRGRVEAAWLSGRTRAGSSPVSS